MQNKNILIFIPTYNEKDNVRVIVDLINNNHAYLDILFLDDNSPDGSGEIAKQCDWIVIKNEKN